MRRTFLLCTAALIAGSLSVNAIEKDVPMNIMDAGPLSTGGLTVKTDTGGVKKLVLSSDGAAGADLFLPFENATEWKKFPYKYISGAPRLVVNKVGAGLHSAAFNGDNSLVFKPLSGSVFSKIGDFSIDFMVNPSRLSDGGSILTYQARLLDNKPGTRDQSVVCDFERGRLVWRFTNVFFLGSKSLDIEMSGSPLLIGSWRRHTLRYDSEANMLEVLDNGVVTDVKYVTARGDEESAPYLGVWDRSSNDVLEIGAFSGYLDDFTILPTSVINRAMTPFRDKGELITRAFDISGAKFLKARPIGTLLNDATWRMYYRFASSRAALELTNADAIPWAPYNPEALFTGVQSQYIQFKVDFFAGRSAITSPVFQDIILTNNVTLPPSRPLGLTFEAKSDGVLVKWGRAPTASIKGYKLYFGTKSGEYFGSIPAANSPVDVGDMNEFFITGLEAGRRYYFTVAAYDDSIPQRMGLFAVEQTYLP